MLQQKSEHCYHTEKGLLEIKRGIQFEFGTEFTKDYIQIKIQ